jgi:hypothetical protein
MQLKSSQKFSALMQQSRISAKSQQNYIDSLTVLEQYFSKDAEEILEAQMLEYLCKLFQKSYSDFRKIRPAFRFFFNKTLNKNWTIFNCPVPQVLKKKMDRKLNKDAELLQGVEPDVKSKINTVSKPVSPLRQRMIEDMNLAGLAQSTQTLYIGVVADVQKYFTRCAQDLTEKEIRKYFVWLSQEKKVPRGTFLPIMAGLRFFYESTLCKNWELFTKKKSVCPSKAICLSR